MGRFLRRSIFAFPLFFLTGLLLPLSGSGQDSLPPTLPPVAAPVAPNTVVPLTFPVLSKVNWTDTFNPDDPAKGRLHHGQDLMAEKMTPLVAAFDGQVFVHPTPGHNMLSIRGDNGYECLYCHINDDTPGSHDHNGTADYAYAPGLQTGDHVVAGQLIGWVGDSGNARGGPPHCHFELTCNGAYLNPAPSLRGARHLKQPILALPQLQLKPEKGEIRLDGVVRSFDGNKTLVMRLLAHTLPGNPTVVEAHPAKRWVLLQPDTILRRRDETEQPLTTGELKEGAPIIVVGKDQGKDKALLARLAAVQPAPSAQIALESQGRPAFAPIELDAPLRNVERNQPRVTRRPTPPARTLTDTETRLLEMVNAVRRENNLPLLVVDARLSEAAWKHSLDMATVGFYGHAGSDGSTLFMRLNQAGYIYTDAAEDLGVNFVTPEEVMAAWTVTASKGRLQLLNPAFRKVGVAYVHIAADASQPRRVERAWTLVLAAAAP